MFSDYFADKTPILSSRILVMSEKKNMGLQGFPASPPDGRERAGNPGPTDYESAALTAELRALNRASSL